MAGKTIILSNLFFLLPGRMIYLMAAMMVLVILLVIIVSFVIVYLLFKTRQEKKKLKWRKNVDLLIQLVIFFEEEGSPADSKIPITLKINRWLKKAAFRQFLIDELLLAKKSLSGSAADNLIKLYDQLGFEKDSVQKLEHSKWHIKARGIQELSAMNQKQLFEKIYRFTNDRNELVRIEAQSALVGFSGFEGLRFLDVIAYPISEWQQIKLLHQLSHIPSAQFKDVDKWLHSKNDSVVILAIKLVGAYHLFDLHDIVVECLRHPLEAIKLQAVDCLRNIYTDSTASHITRFYAENNKNYKQAALQALGELGTEEDIIFLQSELQHGDDTMKLAAARALSKINGVGIKALASVAHSGEYPWNEIISQVNSELKA